MIFVTVGAQMPFDRLVRAVDDWAGEHGRQDVFAQIGHTRFRPRHVEWTALLSPAEFRSRIFDAHAVITHAGMGTIITALELGRPILVYPRLADRRESRNDHQVGTAETFARGGRVATARTDAELTSWLNRLATIPVHPRIPSHASTELLTTIRRFIETGLESESSRPGIDHAPLPHPALHNEEESPKRRRAA